MGELVKYWFPKLTKLVTMFPIKFITILLDFEGFSNNLSCIIV